MTYERQIVLDTETTGLYADRGDRLVEFAGIEMKNRQLTMNNLHLFVHPQRDIPEEAAAVHGITLDKLEAENAPPFEAVGQRIADFLRGAELIIHNARFDVGFLDMEFARMGLPGIRELGCKVTDTLALAKEKLPGKKVSLDALCGHLGVDRSRRVLHGALIDCELLAEVYLAMTRQQFDLMEGDGGENRALAAQARPASLPVRQGGLVVLAADEGELAEHEAYLAGLEKGGGCLWLRGRQE
ncbi:MAG: DNA polymerase III subunit epsilon [Neisseria sp.]|nr:DNA polymerase III subunit epsilon [Neisseria sp.]